MREFGGSDALPDLAELLDDTEPQVQRDAIRAILNVGTDAGIPYAPAGPGDRHRAGPAKPSCRRSAPSATNGPRRCSPTSCGTSIIAGRSRRSICARSNRSARCAIPRHRAAQGSAVPRRVVGAAADGALRRRRPRALARIGTPEATTVLGEAATRGSARRARRRRDRISPHAAPPRRRPRGRLVTTPRCNSPTNCCAASRRRCDRRQLYSRGPSDHRAQPRSVRRRQSRSIHALQPTIVIGLVGDEVVVDDMPMAKADTLGPLVRRLQQSGVERVDDRPRRDARRARAFIDARRSPLEPRERDDAPRRRVSRRCRTSASAASRSNGASKATSPTWRRSSDCMATPSRSPAISGTARTPKASPTRRWRAR